MFPPLSNIPIQPIQSEVLQKNNVSLFIQRDDLIHADVSGNKWRKLKNNINYFFEKQFSEIVTFGGAYSNHIAATAAAGKLCGISTVGIIRGEPHSTANPTLAKAMDDGMLLKYVSRSSYSDKLSSKEVATILQEFSNPYIIPEGGDNRLGLMGCSEIIDKEKHFDLYVTACGTGSTLGGMVAGLEGRSWVLGFPVLKGMNRLAREIDDNLFKLGITNPSNWSLNHNYHFGGYAKADSSLINFICDFWKNHNIKLDPIYTGKAMYGAFDLIQKGQIQNQRVLFVHTGGLQGIQGFEDRYQIKLFS